jgi:hypothetical protein
MYPNSANKITTTLMTARSSFSLVCSNSGLRSCRSRRAIHAGVDPTSIFPIAITVAADCEKPSGPQNVMAAVTIATVTSKVVWARLFPSMRISRQYEFCAELGRYSRLMGSLHPRIDTTLACRDGNPLNKNV